jgi:hypothetical protein
MVLTIYLADKLQTIGDSACIPENNDVMRSKFMGRYELRIY